MFRLLADYLDTEPGVGEALTSPADVMPEPETTVGPDVFVMPVDVARLARKRFPVRRLLLAVEVLSPGDRSGDRTRKRRLYQRTIPEYWIVDTDARRIELWRPNATAPELIADQLEWHPAGASRPFIVDVVAYFARVFQEDR
jgi:Uma2 family endonuclease